MIFTTNKSLKAWDECCTTMISRKPFSIGCSSAGVCCGSRGPPYALCDVNLDEAMKEDSDQETTWSEFPELTTATLNLGM